MLKEGRSKAIIAENVQELVRLGYSEIEARNIAYENARTYIRPRPKNRLNPNLPNVSPKQMEKYYGEDEEG